ncbi:MAG: hypothetical protein BGO26_16685 [Actinobacteria bacterium 69-20]|nr:hypothetical protein [Actinomycetota bacterium]OJV27109.1 MAG: hypothetical protein BGO26_16685 [Actinobacteria bacterium 69-20]
MSDYIVTDDNGAPEAVIDMDRITDAGTKLAFRLAAERDEDKRMAITAQVMTEVGSAGFGYVAACAMQVLARDLLHPVLEVADAGGIHLRPGIEAIAEGRDPMAANR